jgi:hypothetical protein
MDKDDIKQAVLEVMEVQLESQLRAIRQLRGEPVATSPLPLRSGKRRKSLVDLSIQILTDEGKPLHVNTISQLLQKRFGRLADRDTLSSSLSKKARSGILLRQTAPATFALLHFEEDTHEKT